MRYLDICSGISAPTMAWKPLGWEALCFAEIEQAPRAVLAHHYPQVPLVGDFTQIRGAEYGPVDLLVGGTPCQSFSVAGLRGGLADERGNLALEYLRLADRARPRWLVWENVPGVLSSNSGRDFGTFLGGLGELGYGFAYAVLDAQHFGVPQRRRRVFVVGHLGDWRRAAAVLFERHSLSGDTAPRREKGEDVAGAIAARSFCGGPGGRPEGAAANHFIPQGCGGEITPTLNAEFGSKLGLDNQHIDSGAGPFVAHSLRGEGFDASEDGTGRGTPIVVDTLTSNGDAHSGYRDERELVPVAIQERAVSENPEAGPDGAGFRTDGQAYTLEARAVPQAIAFGGQMSTPHWQHDLSDTLQAKNPKAVQSGSAVRRLTPRECERLQGFPDDFTLVPYRKGVMADGPRYKMLGNSMAVPVIRWIGERIARVDALCASERQAA